MNISFHFLLLFLPSRNRDLVFLLGSDRPIYLYLLALFAELRPAFTEAKTASAVMGVCRRSLYEVDFNGVSAIVEKVCYFVILFFGF